MPPHLWLQTLSDADSTQLLHDLAIYRAVPVADVPCDAACNLVEFGLARFADESLVAAEPVHTKQTIRQAVNAWLPDLFPAASEG